MIFQVNSKLHNIAALLETRSYQGGGALDPQHWSCVCFQLLSFRQYHRAEYVGLIWVLIRIRVACFSMQNDDPLIGCSCLEEG
jgi:hypothetical protein